MGMYTEIHVAGECKIETDVARIIEHLFSDGHEPDKLPDHEFFKCDRWRHIGSRSSFCCSPVTISKTMSFDYIQGTLFFNSVSNIKNYDGEIDKFFDWLTSEKIEHYGHSRYEETMGEVKTYLYEVGEK